MTKFRFTDEPPPPPESGLGWRERRHPVIYADMENLLEAGEPGETQGYAFPSKEDRDKVVGTIRGYARSLGGLSVLTRKQEPTKFWVMKRG